MFADGSWQRGGWRVGRRFSDGNGNGGGPMTVIRQQQRRRYEDDNDDDAGVGWRVASGRPVAAKKRGGSGGEV